MDSLMKADIFFVVTTVAVFFVTGVAVWVMVYVVKILRNVENISETVKTETKKLSQDIDGLREHVKQRGALPRFLLRWMGRAGGARRERAHASDKK
ncbi:MAG: hypothetical protein HY007_04220 [Candidatus Sungbacteria bacterium]|nr:hypothetical protein [Candidatus Sungbacteria bacterium]